MTDRSAIDESDALVAALPALPATPHDGIVDTGPVAHRPDTAATAAQVVTATEAGAEGAAVPVDGARRVGTLTYTKAGLFALFFWLLWGDFCFTLMETVIPSITPLMLDRLGAPASLISLLMSAMPSALAAMVCPVVSFRSDRLRSRWGRRIPYLLIPTPFLALALALIGYVEPIGAWVARLGVFDSTVSQATIVLGLLSVLLVGFQFCNMFVSSIYYYLFNDVVPPALLARFMAMFRVVGTGAAAAYNMFVFPHAQTHTKQIFVGAALLYLVGFTTMCLFVKEGQYPPPPENIGRRRGLIAAVKTYWVECFGHRFYWNFFLANMFWALVGCVSAFSVLLSLSLGLTLTQLGQIAGWSALIGTILLYPAGMLTDRLHPLRVAIGVASVLVPVYAAQMIYLFVDVPPRIVLAIAIAHASVTLPVMVMWNAAEFPLMMKLLPREQYGQFASANALVRSLAVIVGSLVAGAVIDALRRVHGGSDFAYRYLPVWQTLFFGLALIFFVRVYRAWKARGGDAGYEPPVPPKSLAGAGAGANAGAV